MKNQWKKGLSVILCIALLLSCNAQVFAVGFNIFDDGTYLDSKQSEMKLKLDVSGTEITKEIAVLGDIDGDGKISVSDARSVLRAAVALDTLTGAKAAAGDVDFSGSITVGDARLVLRAAVSLDRSDSWMASFK